MSSFVFGITSGIALYAITEVIVLKRRVAALEHLISRLPPSTW